jgi:hypothetical protein
MVSFKRASTPMAENLRKKMENQAKEITRLIEADRQDDEATFAQ